MPEVLVVHSEGLTPYIKVRWVGTTHLALTELIPIAVFEGVNSVETPRFGASDVTPFFLEAMTPGEQIYILLTLERSIEREAGRDKMAKFICDIVFEDFVEPLMASESWRGGTANGCPITLNVQVNTALVGHHRILAKCGDTPEAA